MKHALTFAAAICLCGSVSLAQQPAPPNTQSTTANPHTAALKAQADFVWSLVYRTAEKVPEELYSFKPTPEVRSLGGVLGHIADGSRLICGFARGDKPQFNPETEKKTTRAEIVAGLKAAQAACDAVFASMTDASGAETLTVFGTTQTRLATLAVNNSHMWEHYGNLVTYMRLKNIVPPTSEPSQ
jgi:uncharacterized damage-inducible protein DinB